MSFDRAMELTVLGFFAIAIGGVVCLILYSIYKGLRDGSLFDDLAGMNGEGVLILFAFVGAVILVAVAGIVWFVANHFGA